MYYGYEITLRFLGLLFTSKRREQRDSHSFASKRAKILLANYENCY